MQHSLIDQLFVNENKNVTVHKKKTNKEKDTKHLAKHTTLLKYVYFMITIKLCF